MVVDELLVLFDRLKPFDILIISASVLDAFPLLSVLRAVIILLLVQIHSRICLL